MGKISVSPVPCSFSKVRDQGAVIVGGRRHTPIAAVLAGAVPAAVLAGGRGAGSSFPGFLSLRDLSRDWRKKYWRYGTSKRVQASTICSISTVIVTVTQCHQYGRFKVIRIRLLVFTN
jgi:hypothetical protein